MLYWRPLLARRRETALAVGLFLLTAAPVVVFDVAHHSEAGSYFRNTTLLARHLAPRDLVRELASNYAAFFSRGFLFESSNDKIIRHSVGEHGELYPFFAPLLVLGVVTALLRRDRAMRLPLLWLALYPIAPALMNEIPSASRGIPARPPSVWWRRSVPAQSSGWRRASAGAAPSPWRCRERWRSPASRC
jgi:hypothetical protein